jgi:hypothetical protein
VHAEAVALPRAHLGQRDVPDLIRALAHRDLRSRAGRRHRRRGRAHAGGVLGEQCESSSRRRPTWRREGRVRQVGFSPDPTWLQETCPD